MAKRWEDLGNDQWRLTLSPDEGGPASVYYGTKEEIREKLEDSQVHAIRRIEQLRAAPVSNGNGHASPPSQPKALTPDERMQTVADLSNPANVVEGVKRAVESVMGPMAQITHDRQAAAAIETAEIFAAETPEWYPSDHNGNTLVGYMRSQNLDPTSLASYQQAFHRLSAAQLLQPKPVEAATDDNAPQAVEPQERNAQNLPPRMAPARYSTGIRSSDVSGTQPAPSKRLKFTREQIDNMSPSTYRSHMSDPEFQRAIEFYSRPRRMQATA